MGMMFRRNKLRQKEAAEQVASQLVERNATSPVADAPETKETVTAEPKKRGRKPKW